MSNQTVMLTALKDFNGNSLTDTGKKPRVLYIPEDSIGEIVPNAPNGKEVLHSAKVYQKGKTYGKAAYVFENALQIETMRDPAASNIKATDKALAAAAAGNAQGAGLDLTKYLTQVTTATAASADSLDLPVAVAGLVRVVINGHASITLQIYPQSGETFSDEAEDAGKDILPGERKHYVCLTDGVWIVADDKGV